MSLFMGIDSSTQSIKAVIINPDNASVLAVESVNFGSELGEKYNSPEGVIINNNPLIKHSNPLMWVEALEILFNKLKNKKIPLCEIRRIAGCGQQHGSVYLNENFNQIISNPDKNLPLYKNIEAALSRKSSPIWMDSSTTEQCEKLSELLGKEYIRKHTGSPPIERFTGPQIMKFYEQERELYTQTALIHLVSSFMCSILAGKSAPIDYGDGAGMNLMDIETLQWNEKICNSVAPNLISKLPPLANAGKIIGKINPYFTKFGFSEECEICTWTGDNPASLVGTGASVGEIAVVSLGTSDTLFAAMSKPHTDPQGYGHVFGNPAGGFMSLICFKNGSLAREKIKNECGVDWDYFGTTAFNNTQPGGGTENIILPYFVPEITPLVLKPGIKLFGSPEFVSGNCHKDLKIRAIVESQILSMKYHSSWIGESFRKIRITGGGSKSQGICKTAADIFQAEVETISIPDSAALGSAIISAAANNQYSFRELSAKFAKPSNSFKPNTSLANIYEKMLAKFAEVEKLAENLK